VVGWDNQFAALVQYKAQYGDCNVPQDWSEPHGLGSWVSDQRRHKKAGRLSPDHQRRLVALGVEWTRQATGKAGLRGKKPST
jgi:hypothetical protein